MASSILAILTVVRALPSRGVRRTASASCKLSAATRAVWRPVGLGSGGVGVGVRAGGGVRLVAAAVGGVWVACIGGGGTELGALRADGSAVELER